RWKAPVLTWLLAADWLVLPALTALGSVFFFVRWLRLRDPRTAESVTGQCVEYDPQSDPSCALPASSGPLRSPRSTVLYPVQFLFALAMMVGWEWLGQPVLQCPYYASLL